MKRGPKPGKQSQRDGEIVKRALMGEAQADIARDLALTRERVRQIVARAGFSQEAATARTRATAERQQAARAAKRHKRAEAMGVTTEEWRALKQHRRHYRQLKRNCHARGIPFELTVRQYASICGSLPMGRIKGSYVLAPRDFAKGYVLGNLILRTASANCRATRARDNASAPRRAVSTGVYLLYPGTRHPYVARYSRKTLGHFPTVEAAIKARNDFMQRSAA